MADDERRTSKRSRFDQTEPEPKRASRFDRRSRSPMSRQPETRRSRSPIASNKTLNSSAEGLKSPADPATAAGMSFDTVDHLRIMLTLFAAAAAARINAQIQAKKGIQHVEVPPIRPV